MNTLAIIEQIDREIERLTQARAILSGTTTAKRQRGRPKNIQAISAPTAKRVLSKEAKEKIAAAQRLRWAKAKRAAKKAA
jgi:hypothetical protein